MDILGIKEACYDFYKTKTGCGSTSDPETQLPNQIDLQTEFVRKNRSNSRIGLKCRHKPERGWLKPKLLGTNQTRKM
jgi:hypothetical protein